MYFVHLSNFFSVQENSRTKSSKLYNTYKLINEILIYLYIYIYYVINYAKNAPNVETYCVIFTQLLTKIPS
jgi:hypothetical protein